MYKWLAHDLLKAQMYTALKMDLNSMKKMTDGFSNFSTRCIHLHCASNQLTKVNIMHVPTGRSLMLDHAQELIHAHMICTIHILTNHQHALEITCSHASTDYSLAMMSNLPNVLWTVFSTFNLDTEIWDVTKIMGALVYKKLIFNGQNSDSRDFTILCFKTLLWTNCHNTFPFFYLNFPITTDPKCLFIIRKLNMTWILSMPRSCRIEYLFKNKKCLSSQNQIPMLFL